MQDQEHAAAPPPLVPMVAERNPSGRPGTIKSMLKSEYHRWGFVIYRGAGTYNAEMQPLWTAFLADIRQVSDYHLNRRNLLGHLGPYELRTVMEDPSFDTASKENIREHFRAWVQSRSVDRDGPGVDAADLPRLVPRFAYCIYVDRDCLRSLWKILWPVGFGLQGDVVVINGRLIPGKNAVYDDDDNDDQGEDEYEPVEGSTAFDVGWMYIGAGNIPSTYDELGLGYDTGLGVWETFYQGPPLSTLRPSRQSRDWRMRQNTRGKAMCRFRFIDGDTAAGAPAA